MTNVRRHASVIFKAAAPSQCPFLELSIPIDHGSVTTKAIFTME